MILYDTKNVYEAAKERIRFLYSLGRPISVSFSGGKDSTALLHVTLEVAKELGIKKVPVMFIDQECEYNAVIEYVRHVMAMPEVEPYWLQVPFRLWNANNGSWFIPWEEGKEWMRQKEPNSIHENVFGGDRFKDMFYHFDYHFFGEGAMNLGGMRIEESLVRRTALTQSETIKGTGIMWGKNTGFHGVSTLYPLFDWSFRDIWYYIFENKFEYCKVYNYLFAKMPLRNCRVSSLIHENSNANIPLLQEVDPDAYNKMYKRIPAVGTVNHILLDVFDELSDYPSCFANWPEYLSYLIENIIVDENKETFRKALKGAIEKTSAWTEKDREDVYQTFARGIITEDFVMSKLANMMLRHSSKYKFKGFKYFKEEDHVQKQPEKSV